MYLENVVVDALDPQRLGGFWEAALGGERLTDEPGVLETRIGPDGGPVLDLCFQQVPERPREPQRLHLDLRGDAQQAEVVERLLALGAVHLDIGQHAGAGVPWVVLADPEGNPFCVMEARPAYTGTGPVAALPLDSADPERDADFWAWLSGWTRVADAAPVTLRHPSGRGPLLELFPEPASKDDSTKNRMHLDIRLESGEEADQVAAGITERGGQEVRHPEWGDLPWRFFLDPSGNELCLLPAREA